MAIVIQPFDASRTEAVRAFNRRLAEAGAGWQFPELPEPSWLARCNGSPVYQEFLLALDGDAVRGAYALQHRPAAIGGELEPVDTWYLPISEGVIDPRYALVAMALVRDALRRAPNSFCLGMNGIDSPVAKLAARLGCAPRLVPFFVRIENGARFLREARRLRRRPALARLFDVGAATGAGTLAAGLLKRVLARSRPDAGTRVESVDDFGAWADQIWEHAHRRYSFVELRDAATLNRVYPEGRARLRRLRVSQGGTTLGWAVIQATRMRDNPNFGSLHVGRITDAFAAPEHAEVVIRAAADALAGEGVELIISNQNHPAWCQALRRSAFLPAPSNYAFAPAPDLAKRFEAIDPDWKRMHLNRGDGDGPWGHDPRAF